ncbi:hypothetical protein [Candidatus Mycoplasma haematominutum]|uniref:Lipoprotein n=1 Tax=Candidatus Mycoplasma haematominutum 'Birmingham 1' TaxID=1116213 RepID=G8C3F2_9MOLU|nr:hypothetical protein [Candidatus Mycoplasma haematominutum]CCE66850.1 hypothetical protein MHM_03320 [Candidatus Mycoplasma haematominutum 'Birmingham 1']
MSLKLQLLGTFLTTSAVATVATPLTMISKFSVYDEPFSELTLQKIVEEADKSYKSRGGTKKIEDILTAERIQEFSQLMGKVKLHSANKRDMINPPIELSQTERELIVSFYAAYSLLKLENTELFSLSREVDDDSFKPFEGLKAGKVLQSLDRLDWTSENLSFSKVSETEEAGNSSASFNTLYSEIPTLREKFKNPQIEHSEKLKKEAIWDISNWLIREMEGIHKAYF